MSERRIVSEDEWLRARRALLVKEKEHMRAGDRLAAERRARPIVKVEKDYVFDAPGGEVSLADLFDGCSQLIIHHLMYHPDWEAACPGCSFQADHIEGPRPHLEHHDVQIVAVSRAPLTKLEAYKERMGWSFDWVSSNRSDFNYDFHVAFTKDQLAEGEVDYNFGTITVDPRYQSEELPGVSVFYKDPDGQVFHSYFDLRAGPRRHSRRQSQSRPHTKGCEVDYPSWPRRHDEYEEDSRRSSAA